MERPEHLLNYVDGELVPADGGQWIEDVEPATGGLLCKVPRSDGRDVERAVESARAAFPAWADAPPAERSRWLMRLADAIDARFDALAIDESMDNGKPVELCRSVDIPRAVRNLRFFATQILHWDSAMHPMGGERRPTAINWTLRQPRGVAGCISPWNLPLYLFTWKIAPALATGNTVVAKPSELTPLTAYRLAELAREIDFPRGVLNVLHGYGPEVGQAIVEHPAIPAVSFTGGTATGKAIAAAAAPMFKKLSLELGGKNASVIFADADLDEAIPAVTRAAFANQGQICLCGSRILVERSVLDRVTEGVLERTRALACGDPLEAGTRQGALVSAAHRDKVESYVRLAEAEGGTVLCGGRRPDPASLPERVRDGFFLEPALISGLAAHCRTNTEEIFGPVATIIPFEDEAEALAHANATPYGLAASVWTSDLRRAHRVAAAIDAGIVWVNCWLHRDLRTPFGGVKASGVGREGGEEALRFFTEPKNVCIRVDGGS